MNYYEFFELPVSLEVDLKHLKQLFYNNSKKYHPDFFTLESPEAQLEALNKSTLNNEAYKTLSNFDLRVKYFLELHDQLEPEGENQIPQDFLMEMMELNEQMMELEFDFDESIHNQMKSTCEQLKDELRRRIAPLETMEAHQFEQEDWNLLKDFYLKNQYLKRLDTNLDKLRSTN